ncbi:hypothetical protein K0U07_00755 [bacterium]|nr:hypothetical protein [bacterium]
MQTHSPTLQRLLSAGYTKEQVLSLIHTRLAATSPTHKIWKEESTSNVKIHPFLRCEVFRIIFSFFKNLFSKKPKQLSVATTSPPAKPASTVKKASSVASSTRKLPPPARPSRHLPSTAPSRTHTRRARAPVTESLSPLRSSPTQGLPNFTGPLVNVCYSNAAVQMIANIPGLEAAIRSSNMQGKSIHVKSLKASLTFLIETMQNPTSEARVLDTAARTFWRAFQTCLISHPIGHLTPGVGRLNDSGEFLAYLGEMFDIPALSSRTYDLSLAFREAQQSAIATADAAAGDVVVANIDQRTGVRPREYITFGAHTYELCGIINFRSSHYTGCTRSRNGTWNNYNDRRVDTNRKEQYSPRVVIYQRIQG